MPEKISSMINTHTYPGIYYRFPFLLRIHHLITRLTTLRNWYVKPAISRILKNLPTSFRFYDAGCGAGDMIIPYLTKYSSSFFFGADKIYDNIKICSEYADKNKLNNCAFFQAKAEEYILGEPVDVVSCITVLQYIEDDEKVLQNFYKSLKPGGIFVLYIPVNYNRIFPWYTRLLNKYSHSLDYDTQQGIKHHYKPEEIIEKVKASGFKIESIKYTYKTSGKISFELYSTGLLLIKKLPLFFSILFLPLFVLLVFPFILLFMSIDLIQKGVSGNGILIIAKK